MRLEPDTVDERAHSGRSHVGMLGSMKIQNMSSGSPFRDRSPSHQAEKAAGNVWPMCRPSTAVNLPRGAIAKTSRIVNEPARARSFGGADESIRGDFGH
jgi:hypothetical protein